MRASSGAVVRTGSVSLIGASSRSIQVYRISYPIADVCICIVFEDHWGPKIPLCARHALAPSMPSPSSALLDRGDFLGGAIYEASACKRGPCPSARSCEVQVLAFSAEVRFRFASSGFGWLHQGGVIGLLERVLWMLCRLQLTPLFRESTRLAYGASAPLRRVWA
jgi:hypothetical protein